MVTQIHYVLITYIFKLDTVKTNIYYQLINLQVRNGIR